MLRHDFQHLFPFLFPLSSSPPLSPSLSRCAAVSVSFHHTVSPVHANQFWVQDLGSIQPMSGVTSTAPLSHEELEIDYEALDEQCPSVAKQGRSCDQVQVVLRGRLARTDPANARGQAVPLNDCVLSKCKCLHAHAFFLISFDPS